MEWRWPWANRSRDAATIIGAELLYDMAWKPIRRVRAECGAKIAPHELLAQYEADEHVRPLVERFRKVVRSATWSDAEERRLTLAAVQLVTARVDRDLAKEERLADLREELTAERDEITYERATTKQRALLRGAFTHLRRRRQEGEFDCICDVWEITDPPRKFTIQLRDYEYNVLIKHVEPFIKAALGKDFSRGGLKRALECVYEELQAETHGLSLEQFRAAKLAEEKVMETAPRRPPAVLLEEEDVRQAMRDDPVADANLGRSMPTS